MRISVNVQGVDSVIREMTQRGVEARKRADNVTEMYARKMANDSADMAPVDTGDLRASIAASPERVADGEWQYGSDLAYARRQEYEHKSHKGFIRKSVWRNREAYRNKLREEVARK